MNFYFSWSPRLRLRLKRLKTDAQLTLNGMLLRGSYGPRCMLNTGWSLFGTRPSGFTLVRRPSSSSQRLRTLWSSRRAPLLSSVSHIDKPFTSTCNVAFQCFFLRFYEVLYAHVFLSVDMFIESSFQRVPPLPPPC